MRHISEGELRSLLDRQLSRDQETNCLAHLKDCQLCRANLQMLEQRAAVVSSILDNLSEAAETVSWASSRSRLENYLKEKENNSMEKIRTVFSSRLAVGALVLIFLAALLAVPQVRAIAANFLGLFRVEQVAVIPINPSVFEGSQRDMGPRFQQMLASDMKVEYSGERLTLDQISEASGMVDYPLRMPALLPNPNKIVVEPGVRMEYIVDLPRLKANMTELGQDISFLPESLHRASIVGEVPASVTTIFGSCEAKNFNHEEKSFEDSGCMTFIQLPSPTVTAPPGLDIDAIAMAYLKASGMGEREAQRFNERIDWSTTLVIPIPSNASSRDVRVDGVEGILVTSRYSEYMLIWVKDGILYALGGVGDSASALAAANSLETR
jgi:hypothetical protein